MATASQRDAAELFRTGAELSATGLSLAERYRAVRGMTDRLTEGLSAEDMVAQSMPDASPTKWHLGHTTWFFETFLLAPNLPGYQPVDPDFAYLFNSYYEAMGPRQPRPSRGLLTRPPLDVVSAYRARIDERMEPILARAENDAAVAALVETGLHHEQQHQELLLMDILSLFAAHPLKPAYRRADFATAVADPDYRSVAFIAHDGGLLEIGHGGNGFAFDNEQPRHPAYTAPFRLADRLITNAEWIEFIDAGGYHDPGLWLADGWAVAEAEGWETPGYWRWDDDQGWCQMTLRGEWPVEPGAPVSHVSFYEAQAFARWAGRRLPSEVEWETAAADRAVEGNLLATGNLRPRPARASDDGLPRQLFGDVWEWTQSGYGPYPGFYASRDALGEYNGKFMCNQYVLRGGACVTPPGHVRATYRNFFYPHQRWMFSGLRLAEDG